MSATQPHANVPARNRRRARIGMLLGGLCVVALSAAIRYYWSAEPAQADPVPQTAATAARAQAQADAQPGKPAQLKVVATVNGKQITREMLARECKRHYGKDVLESLVNKYLIVQECNRRKVAVTEAEVEAEIKRMAQRFSLPTDQWLKLLKQERGIGPAQYASDIIWPTLALRKLAGEKLAVSKEELQKSFQTQYGPAVDARLIACKDRKKAEEVRAKAAANPEDFAKLAKDYSEDTPSASSGGRIQPIRMHGSYPAIEKAAFGMKDGEISAVLEAGDQYVVVQRKRLLPAAGVKFEQAAPQLEEVIRDRKLRAVAAEVFQRLQKTAKVENVMNDPAKGRQMPGVAAVINGHPIPIGELEQQCFERHGAEVLDGTINRQLIEQACAKRNITVSEKEVEAEIARAAATSVKPKADGSPDVAAWLKLVTEEQGISEDVYRITAVWPSVALKKLVGDDVKVTQEDLQKGFDANYGPRVRCLAIVLNNLRRAQQVWEMARTNPTADYFGDLAAEYSIESSSRVLRGKVPPIKRHGGQPLLEKEAFALRSGELSGIIQVDERFVILFCEGHTEPTNVAFEKVRDLIYEDIHEKKQRMAMAEYFQHLQDTATIDNYLAGTTQSPKKPGEAPSAETRSTAGGSSKRQSGGVQPASLQASPLTRQPNSLQRTVTPPRFREVPAKRN